MTLLGTMPIGRPVKDFAQLIQDDHTKWGATIKKANIRLD
jgi:hypothetical protein